MIGMYRKKAVFKKGYRAVMELVRILKDHGFYAVRIPVSGSRVIPCDIIASNKERKYAIEVKVTTDEKIYVSKDRIRRLIEFSDYFGLDPIVAVQSKKRFHST